MSGKEWQADCGLCSSLPSARPSVLTNTADMQAKSKTSQVSLIGDL